MSSDVVTEWANLIVDNTVSVILGDIVLGSVVVLLWYKVSHSDSEVAGSIPTRTAVE